MPTLLLTPYQWMRANDQPPPRARSPQMPSLWCTLIISPLGSRFAYAVACLTLLLACLIGKSDLELINFSTQIYFPQSFPLSVAPDTSSCPGQKHSSHSSFFFSFPPTFNFSVSLTPLALKGYPRCDDFSLAPLAAPMPRTFTFYLDFYNSVLTAVLPPPCPMQSTFQNTKQIMLPFTLGCLKCFLYS